MNAAKTARLTLGAVRLANGSVALAAPRWYGGKAGLDLDRDPAAVHIVRMFGVRTVLLGADVLVRPAPVRRASLLVAPLVHGADLASALTAARRGELPRKAAVTAAGFSAINLVASVVCLKEETP